MAMDPADTAGPVIASSNRFADVAPYVNCLFAEDEHKWIRVLPWQFPQNGTKEQEEEFLRRFFDEREIHMQGFRFLKQVWYTAAKWNLECRLPCIVNWWFENNQELLNDPSMKQHFFSEGVQPSTFFEADQIKMYGEELLGWAVHIIQFHLRQQTAAQAPVNARDDQANQVPTQSNNTHTVNTTSQTAPEAAPPQPVAPIMAPDSSAPAPPPASTAPAAAMPVIAGHGKDSQARNFSSGSYPSDDRPQQQYRRNRGSYGSKRGSFNQPRPTPRLANTFGDARHMSNPYSPYGAPAAPISPMPPLSTPMTHRLPSGGPYQAPGGPLPPLFQGQQLQGSPHPNYPFQQAMPPQYGQQMQHMAPQQQMHPHAGPHGPGVLPPAGVPSAYVQPQPFYDRSNVHPDSRNYVNEHSVFVQEDKPDQRNKRRDSVHSRGGRGRGGYGGSLRGRGSRGRNSFGGEAQLPPRPPPSEVSMPFPQHDRRFSIDREKTWRRGDGQVENSFPPQDARRSIADYGYPVGNPMPRHGGPFLGFNPTGPRTATGLPSAGPPPRRESQLCTAGCEREHISDTCQDVPKLIVFNCPPMLDEQHMKAFFSQFGRVLKVSVPRPPPSAPANKHFMFLTFEDGMGARNCLANSGIPWPHGTLSVEVAKEHWDPEHVSRQGYQQRASTASDTQHLAGVAPQQTATSEPSSEQRASDYSTPKAHEPGMKDLASESTVAASQDVTPTDSGISTPKKSGRKNNKNKNKNKKPSEPREATASPSKDNSGLKEASQNAGQEGTPTKTTPTSSNSGDEAVKKVGEDSDAVPSDSSARVADDDVKVVELDKPEAQEPISKSPAPDSVSATAEDSTVPPKAAGTDAVKDVSAPTNKQEEDQNDDSFHTASGSPGAESAADQATTPTASVETQLEPETEEDKITAPASEFGSAHGSDSVSSKTLAKSPSPSSGVAKAPIPRVPSPKSVTIAVSPVDTEEVKAPGKAPSDSLQVPGQRVISEASEATAPTFVTAPNTPAVPEPAQEPRSKKEPKSKQPKESKQKGPEQTESFSIFAKPKKERKPSKAKDKKSAGKRKGSVLEAPNEAEAAAQDTKSNTVSAKAEKSEGQQEEPKDLSGSEVIKDEAKSSVPSTIAEDIAESVAPEVRSTSEAATLPSEIPPSVDSGIGASAEISYEKGEKAAGKKPMTQSEMPTASDNATVDQLTASEAGDENEQAHDEGANALGITMDSDEAKKKRNNRNKNKNRRDRKKAAAEVTQMTQPGHDDHAGTSNFEYKGNDLGQGPGAPSQTSNNSGRKDKGLADQYVKALQHFTMGHEDRNGSDSSNRASLSGAPSSEANRMSDNIFASVKREVMEIDLPDLPQQDSPEVVQSKKRMIDLKEEEKAKKAGLKRDGKEKEAQ